VQATYKKTSISLPADLLVYLKKESKKEDNIPVSRLVARAVRQMINNSKGASK